MFFESLSPSSMHIVHAIVSYTKWSKRQKKLSNFPGAFGPRFFIITGRESAGIGGIE